MFGLWLVLQQTPLEVTLAPPSPIMVPPLVAEEKVIEVAIVVVSVGRFANVLKEISLP